MAKFVVNCSWDDAPHLSTKEKDEMMKALPPHEREARSMGLPSMGSGRIYPVSDSVFVIPPSRLPDYLPRAFGLDVGWNFTACVFGAYDPESDVWTIYSEYKGEKQEPAVNAASIRARSQGWIRGVIDPASMGVSQSNGQSLIDIYTRNGLDVECANNSVEPGLLEVFQRLTEGRLVVHDTCVKTLEELRLYHRKQNGQPVKVNDHLMDALRYLIMSGQDVMCVQPEEEEKQEREAQSYRSNGVGANPRTGY